MFGCQQRQGCQGHGFYTKLGQFGIKGVAVNNKTTGGFFCCCCCWKGVYFKNSHWLSRSIMANNGNSLFVMFRKHSVVRSFAATEREKQECIFTMVCTSLVSAICLSLICPNFLVQHSDSFVYLVYISNDCFNDIQYIL